MARFQGDILDGSWRGVGRAIASLLVVAFVANTVVVGDGALIGGVTLAGHVVVLHAAHLVNRQGAACDHLTLVVEQLVAGHQQVAASEDLRRVALFDARFVDRAGVVVLVEIVIAVAGTLWRVEVFQAIGGVVIHPHALLSRTPAVG